MVCRESQNQRNDLISEHYLYAERMVKSLMHKLGLPANLYDDFLAAGLLGLVEAAERYDMQSDVPFRNFAFLRIRGSVIDSIRRTSRLTGKTYKVAKALQASYDLHEEYEAVKGNLSRSDRIALLLELGSKSLMSSTIAEEIHSYDELEGDPEKHLLIRENEFQLRSLVLQLPDKERFIIEEYYFRGKSFSQIAEENVSLSKSWISRLHSRALATLKSLFLEHAIQ
jgi:RNA polymerase sigma factor FliA